MSATTRRHTMGAVDAIWLHMDRPENLLVIDTLMWFDGRVDERRLRAVLAERLVERFPVFGMRPAEPLLPLGSPRWETDPDFDLDRHLVVSRLPAPGGDAELRRYVEQRIAEPLDRDRPLWQVHVVHGYHTDDADRATDGAPHGARRRAGSVVLARIHHAVADGIALAHVLLSLTDPEKADGTAAGATVEVTPPDLTADVPAARRGDLPAVLRLPAAAARTAVEGLHLFAELPRLALPGVAADALSLAWQVGRIADKLLLGSLPRTALSGEPGTAKHAVWSPVYDLARVKAVAAATGTTINDVLLAAVGGGLAAYLASHGGTADDLTAMVPVNVRGDAPLPPELGNRFALVLFPLVTGDVDPSARLAATRARMDEIKGSPEAAITFGVMGAIGRTHPEVERVLVDFFSAKAIGVLTNVIGPSRRRVLAGAPMTGVLGWVPQAAGQTLGVCIFSYAGTVRIGFRADAAVVDEPEQLVACFDAALRELGATAGVADDLRAGPADAVGAGGAVDVGGAVHVDDAVDGPASVDVREREPSRRRPRRG